MSAAAAGATGGGGGRTASGGGAGAEDRPGRGRATVELGRLPPPSGASPSLASEADRGREKCIVSSCLLLEVGAILESGEVFPLLRKYIHRPLHP